MAKKPPRWDVRFSPSNSAQRQAADAWELNDVVFLLGAARTGKTHAGMGLALQTLKHANLRNIKTKMPGRILVTRPAITAEDELGFLPGDLNEKFSPYLAPFQHVLCRLILQDKPTGEGEEPLKPEDVLDAVPLGFLRGRTVEPPEHPVLFLDEAQNCTFHQLEMVLTRMGKGSKVIVTGDPVQSDIGNRSGLMEMVDTIGDICGVAVITFTEENNCGHPLVARISKKCNQKRKNL